LPLPEKQGVGSSILPLVTIMKNLIKKNKSLKKFLSNSRKILSIVFNTKTRSLFFWKLRKGDEKLSFNYELNHNSLVFVIGAYKGDYVKEIINKFNCNLYAFEPLMSHFKVLSNELNLNLNKANIFNFGLLDADQEISFSSIGASSSIYSRPEGKPEDVVVKMRSFEKFINENSIEEIDLVFMNIEGSEYRLLNQIIDSGFIKNIKYLQIQFHDFVDDAHQLRKEIRKNLKLTHKCIFNFPFIWESWKLK
jgi:FkbM family methyltransferase